MHTHKQMHTRAHANVSKFFRSVETKLFRCRNSNSDNPNSHCLSLSAAWSCQPWLKLDLASHLQNAGTVGSSLIWNVISKCSIFKKLFIVVKHILSLIYLINYFLNCYFSHHLCSRTSCQFYEAATARSFFLKRKSDMFQTNTSGVFIILIWLINFEVPAELGTSGIF